ncbi:MAG: autotransporter outer membrane beta-barrel domain-containing protein [Alphaproteobacteria bacterium]|nr:autotransporter outer membrane beta-barrel domain-containing protein [Alphaproteobacteria bacterium]
MRNKTRLLARVSSLAILAAAGSLSVVQEAQAACTTTWTAPIDGTTINTNNTCVIVNAPVAGNLTNQAIIGDPGNGFVPFDVFADINGDLINQGSIGGGFFSGKGGALTIRGGATITGALRNQIGGSGINSVNGNALQIGLGGENGGSILGGIHNDNAITSTLGNAIAAIEGTLVGGLHNDATIGGGLAGVYVSGTFSSWSGGIQNSSIISGSQAAIQLGDGGELAGLTFSNGITNDFGAQIVSGNGTAILIQQDVDSFSGGITNTGEITGASLGISASADAYNGGLLNFGTVDGQSGTGARFDVGTFTGNVTNYGTISGGGELGAGLYLRADTLGGEAGTNVTNYNSITGPNQGVVILGGTANVDFSNTSSDPINNVPPGTISGGRTGVVIAPDTWTGNVTNDGSITGNTFGLLVGATNFDGFNARTETFTGNISNAGTIDGGESGTGLYVMAGTFDGDITNDGTIGGGSIGLSVQGPNPGFGQFGGEFGGECSSSCAFVGGSFEGTITNNSTINGGNYGLLVSTGAFDGDIVNNGSITGNVGAFIGSGTDAFFFGKPTFAGNFTNNGTITGTGTGAVISVGTMTGNITNSSTGRIQGSFDGLRVVVDEMTGSIINNGEIVATTGTNTGLHVIGGTITGDIVNNDLLSAPSNALHVDVTMLNGQVTNTGTIDSGTAQAVLLEIDDGTVPNPTIFENAGHIEGDVLFGGVASAVYRYVGGDGGIDGDLNGVGTGGLNNETILVNGDHYFFGGKASNFSSFTVGNGGTAIMGAHQVGQNTGTSAYVFSNVDAVDVQSGGMLYVDKTTTLNIDESYTQGSGGILAFYLGAPANISTATGSIAAGPGDYGQLIIANGGAVSLDGIIAGVLDHNFVNANPGLTEVRYDDVIVAPDPITTDFIATALLSNSSLYELNSLIDDNTVDLRVVRSSVAQNSTISNVVNTLDPFDSNVADRTNGIGSGGCGLAGGGWCFNRFAANDSPGATQVMSDATPGEDPFAWLRTGVRRVGETAVWGRGVGVWGDTDGEGAIPGTDFSLGGAIVGVDHVFTPLLLAGLAGQWTTTDVAFKGVSDNADIQSYEIGGYASYGDTRLFVNANVSYIWHDFEVNRFSGGGTVANGQYDGDTFSAYVEGGKIFETESGWRLQPVVALSYSHLETDAYSETGVGALLNVLAAELTSLKTIVGGRFAYPLELGSGRKMVPEARAVWTHEFSDTFSSHIADLQGGGFVPQFVRGEEFARDTLVLGTGLSAPLSDATTVFFDYDAGLNTDVTSHTVSAGFRSRW